MYNSATPERVPGSSPHASPRASYRSHVLNPPANLQHPGQGRQNSPASNASPAAKANGHGLQSRDKTSSTFFDPTAEHREPKPSYSSPGFQARSPVHDQHSFNYKIARLEHRPVDQEHASPIASHRTPAYARSPLPLPVEAIEHFPQSPGGRNVYQSPGTASRAKAVIASGRQPSSTTARPDPMSFSSILSSADAGPLTRMSISPPAACKVPRRVDELPSVGTETSQPLPSNGSHGSLRHTLEATPHDDDIITAPHRRPSSNVVTQTEPITASPHSKLPNIHQTAINGYGETFRQEPPRVTKPLPVINDKEYQAALAKVEAMELSDVEISGFEKQKGDYANRSAKRVKEVEIGEDIKRKRRRIAQITKFAEIFDRQAMAAKDGYYEMHEPLAIQQVQQQDQAEEKEHKKVMQRNRRRETQKQKAEQQAAELKRKAQTTDDHAEKERLIQQAQRAEKKATATSRLLNGEAPMKDIREATPSGPNMDGGIVSTFHMGNDGPSQEPPKKKARTGGRLKKSKEQKQAEKDSAAAAHAAMERGEELTPLAPKSDAVARQAAKAEAASARDGTPADRSEKSSKAYDQLYEQIWRDIARKDIPKLYRMKDNSLSTKQSNVRKTAVLASKEARRWQLRTNKSTKETQARAKRVMREMLSFWKRNERDERDQRKMAERQELENARKADADREANRQKRKLNFLISQTELYSHFIGKKVKTDEVERSTDDVETSAQMIRPAAPEAHAITFPDSVAPVPIGKVTNFEDLDFDADDDAALHAAAMANAQNAVQEAQDRARAFNNEGQLQSQFDDGEMNFQNPTSLQSMDIAQPAMLTCQLKEYQLKGLNWLVNLYEQGINGILADEMGLGKTVQSISVMSYLAENHNIWGPFLVIAPASTLHNWQQEIVKFVPTLKVLPYWGNAKDRKVLRKFWDRKHITYTKDSPFHVLVTSYQLVVQDTAYFQKIRWQYMILDEAQAIKSSQSSRWKALLGFHCRNRLLLTGTPIQNNMQELWALLHFIMPSLFDSHDEFSEWFSKDIESHAQSNTKLNEDQLKRLHMILKPFMLRRIKKHVQKELGDKIELDIFCDLTYRQRAYYMNLRNKISLLDLVEKAAIGDDQDTATLMNLVMQFRKVCNHPDLFERADTTSPVSFSYFAETASFLREGFNVEVGYSVRNLIDYRLPRLVARNSGRISLPGPDNEVAGSTNQLLNQTLNVWSPERIAGSSQGNGLFSWLQFSDMSVGGVASLAHKDVFQRAVDLRTKPWLAAADTSEDDSKFKFITQAQSLFKIVENKRIADSSATMGSGVLHDLMNISTSSFADGGFNAIEPCFRPLVAAPPIEVHASCQGVNFEKQRTFFNVSARQALYGIAEKTEQALLEAMIDPTLFPVTSMLPPPISEKARYTEIEVPSMRRFVTDSGKLAKLDALLAQLKEGNHRVLLYFQMTRMIDLMEEYLTYRNYKFCRLDGSTKLEDRRDTVKDFQSRPDIFIFLLSTRAGGLGINLTAADTVIFYDSDWNPTIDSQAMDRAHRLGQTRQVTVYRMITRGTIEERIRKRALQKEEVQRVVISGGAGAHVDFNTRSKENRTKDIAMWLADDEQAAEIEKKEQEIAEREAKGEIVATGSKKKKATGKKKVDLSMDDMYHEGEGHFDDSSKPSGAATPVPAASEAPGKEKRKGVSKKAKTLKEKLAIADGV